MKLTREHWSPHATLRLRSLYLKTTSRFELVSPPRYAALYEVDAGGHLLAVAAASVPDDLMLT